MRALPTIVPPSPARYRFGWFNFDTAPRELGRDGVPVEMAAGVFVCLAHLVAHRARAVAHDELAQAVFFRTDVSDGQLAQIVVRARRCLGDDGRQQWAIRTVPRFGYRWVADTVVVEDDAEMPAAAAAAPSVVVRGRPPAPVRRGRAWIALALFVATAGAGLTWALHP